MGHDVATIILAGGQGTRLHPLTMRRPKPAIPFGGKYRLIDIPISNALNAGLTEIYTLLQYLPAELKTHIEETYPFASISLLTPREGEVFEGTADAVRKCSDILFQSTASHFLILAGDHLYNFDFSDMIAEGKKMGKGLTIASLPVQMPSAKRLGLLLAPEGKIEAFVEKPENEAAYAPFELPHKKEWFLGSMGIYLFERSYLEKLLKKDPGSDFGRHLIYTAVDEHEAAAYTYNGYWEDIGTIKSYYDTHLLLAAREGLDMGDEEFPIYAKRRHLPSPYISGTLSDSILSDGAIVDQSLIRRSVIGPKAIIRQGCTIRDSVLLGNYSGRPSPFHFEIGENCWIEKAIIDEHVRLGRGVRLINEKKLSHYDGEGIFIRDGIIVVTAGTFLPDHYVL